MEYNKLVSVVMPVHNGEKYLREAIESVLNQTYTNFELLIVENCSTDSSLDIIKSYNDPRIRIIIEKDCGQVQAYNRGFKEAKGEFIVIHDQDDVSYPERFGSQLKYIISNNLDIVGSFFSIINTKGELLADVKPPVKHKQIEKVYYYKVRFFYNPTLCIKKDVFLKFGYFKKEYFPSSDFEFALRIMTKVKVGNIPKVLLKWRNHKESLSNKDLKFGFKNAINLAIHYLELNKTRYSESEYVFIKSQIYYYYNNLLKSFGTLALNINKLNSKMIFFLIKLILFFIPIKLLRIKDFFNSKLILRLRKTLSFS